MCTHLYFWLSVSMQSCMLFKGERKSCSQAVRVLASKAQRVAHVLNPLITSVLLMFMTGSGYIVIPILDLFLQLVQVLLMCPCLNWISLGNVHRVYLYFGTSQISDTTFSSCIMLSKVST